MCSAICDCKFCLNFQFDKCKDLVIPGPIEYPDGNDQITSGQISNTFLANAFCEELFLYWSGHYNWKTNVGTLAKKKPGQGEVKHPISGIKSLPPFFTDWSKFRGSHCSLSKLIEKYHLWFRERSKTGGGR